MGDPQGILGGSMTFSGDPSFWDMQMYRVYDVCEGDPVHALALCIILRACIKKKDGLGGPPVLKLYHAVSKTSRPI